MKKSLQLFPILLLIGISSCCKPGMGGDAKLIVTLMHHSAIMNSKVTYPDTVYIKYNATELSNISPSNFDKYFVGTAGSTTIECDGLKCGKYFLFGTAMDSAGPYRVVGGLPFEIKHKERKHTFNVTLAVTE